jgi:hypothetical protein
MSSASSRETIGGTRSGQFANELMKIVVGISIADEPETANEESWKTCGIA